MVAVVELLVVLLVAVHKAAVEMNFGEVEMLQEVHMRAVAVEQGAVYKDMLLAMVEMLLVEAVGLPQIVVLAAVVEMQLAQTVAMVVLA